MSVLKGSRGMYDLKQWAVVIHSTMKIIIPAYDNILKMV